MAMNNGAKFGKFIFLIYLVIILFLVSERFGDAHIGICGRPLSFARNIFTGKCGKYYNCKKPFYLKGSCNITKEREIEEIKKSKVFAETCKRYCNYNGKEIFCRRGINRLNISCGDIIECEELKC